MEGGAAREEGRTDQLVGSESLSLQQLCVGWQGSPQLGNRVVLLFNLHKHGTQSHAHVHTKWHIYLWVLSVNIVDNKELDANSKACMEKPGERGG